MSLFLAKSDIVDSRLALLFLQDLMAQNGITYVLNASNTCPKPDFISESHFMRIPVNDNYCEKLLPWLDKTNAFIGEDLSQFIVLIIPWVPREGMSTHRAC